MMTLARQLRIRWSLSSDTCPLTWLSSLYQPSGYHPGRDQGHFPKETSRDQMIFKSTPWSQSDVLQSLQGGPIVTRAQMNTQYISTDMCTHRYTHHTEEHTQAELQTSVWMLSSLTQIDSQWVLFVRVHDHSQQTTHKSQQHMAVFISCPLGCELALTLHWLGFGSVVFSSNWRTNVAELKEPLST